MNISFTLVEPAVPENIGASARAMNTMGFRDLRLVNPCDYLNEKAMMLAHGSQTVLQNASVYRSLKEAIQDLDFVIGTTAKKRSAKQDCYPAQQIPELLEKKGNTIETIALVFGREESGLTNDEISLCDLVTSIPMDAPYPSLNLSQAVMIYAYIASGYDTPEDDTPPTLPNPESYLSLRQRIIEILDQTAIGENKTLLNRIMERVALLEDDDIHLLHSITHEISLKLKSRRSMGKNSSPELKSGDEV